MNAHRACLCLAALLGLALATDAARAAAPSLASVLLGQAEDGGEVFRSRWESFPDRPFTFTSQDFLFYGGWGRLRPSLPAGPARPRTRRPTEDWNPFRNLDAYTYGAFAIIHEKATFVLPGLRMEFNNIADNLVLCLDLAGPASFNTYAEDVRLGDTLTTERTTEITAAFHAAFSSHFYLLGEIQGPYLGPVAGFHSFYRRRAGYLAFPFLGADAGLRLSLGKGTLVAGVMVYGMALKHVHPDYGFEVYAGLGFLI